MDRAGLARTAGLLLVAFVATFALLVGGWALVGRLGAAAPRATPPPAGPSPGGPVSAPPSAITATPPVALDPRASDAPSVVLTGAGDIADCTRPGASKTADLLGRESGWFFTVGDNAYENGSSADYANCYAPTWGRYRDRTILPAPGNHDWQTKDAAGYRAYFGDRAAPAGVTWYSIDVGTWHVVVLDSDCEAVGGCDDASPQGRWLAADLRSHLAHCTLAIWHHPLFSSGQHGNTKSVKPFWEQLYAARAELVINGHDHDYERFAPQDPDGKEQRPGGIREIVVGTGGSELRGFSRSQANTEFRMSGQWGVLRLTLHPLNYDWEFVPTDGNIADSGSTPCR